MESNSQHLTKQKIQIAANQMLELVLKMTEPKFKHTDIGLIPEDWEIVNWNDIFDFKSTASYSRANLQKQGDIGYIHYGDIHTKINAQLDTDKFVSGYISNEQIKTYSTVNEGDLIIADASEDYAGVGKGFEVINKPNIPVISGLHTFLVREKEKATFAKGFKGYFYHNPLIKKQYDSLATGLKVYSLSKKSFENIQIPIPPLPEQQAIAEVLSDTDTWIESLEQLIAKKQLIKQGAMQKLLTPKEDWEVRELGDVIDVFRGGSPRPIQNFITNVSNGINWIKIGDTTPKGKYIKDTEEKIIPEGEKYSRKVNVGDFLLSNSMSFGRPYILQTEGCIHDGWLVLQHYDLHFESEFLYYLLTSKLVIDQYKRKAAGSGVLNLNKELVKSVSLQYPKISEQTRIATILSDMDLEIEALEQKLAKAQQIKQGLMQELLTGKIRLRVNG